MNRGTGGRGLQGPPAVPTAGALQREARFQLAAAAPRGSGVGWELGARSAVIATGEKSHTL